MISAGLGVYRSLPQNFIIEVTLLRLIAYLHQENNAGKRTPVYARQDRADRQYKSWGSAGGSGIGRSANAGAVDLSLVN